MASQDKVKPAKQLAVQEQVAGSEEPRCIKVRQVQEERCMERLQETLGVRDTGRGVLV